MSMNLTLSATRQVVVVKTGKESIQVVSFDLWKTPTDVTRELLKGDTESKYVNWCMSGKSCAMKHISDVKLFIKSAESEGYEIKWGKE